MKPIKEFSNILLDAIKDKKIHVISHFDTDGITSAAIFSKTLERLSVSFSTKILKNLEKDEIKDFPEDKLLILLDLGSSHIKELSKLKNQIFIIDHHEIETKNIPGNIRILNPHLNDKIDELCSAELTYLVSREISQKNKDLAHLAVIGMIGDVMEKHINKTRNEIIKEADIKIKKGLLIYPSTRPLDKALEYSSRPFFPGITGNSKGTRELLKEAGIGKNGKTYKALIDLDEKEMRNLITALALRSSIKNISEYIGNLYLIKFFNKLEDAREISAIINACSRMGYPEISLMLCLGNGKSRKKAESIYIKYRQNIISSLKFISESRHIEGERYVIINAKNKIKDTLVGTIASILSFSQIYPEGTIIVTMAYRGSSKIKVSIRVSKRNKSKRNLKQLLESVTTPLSEAEVGGHKDAAGCIIRREDEEKFVELLKKQLELEVIKIG